MPILGTARSYHPKFRFQVAIDSILIGSFQSCSELSSEFAEIQQWEGGTVIPYKTPGRLTFDDITLSRGVTGVTDLYEWHRKITNASANTGTLGDAGFKRTADIIQMDRTGLELRRWTLYGCWPKRFSAGDWDNDADENVIESIVLAIDYFELDAPPLAGAIAAARGALGG